MNPTSGLTWQGPSQRCSQRILVRAPVSVCGFLGYKVPFDEETETLVVNAHGALVLLATAVTDSQKLVLKHLQTRKSQECIVAYLGPAQGGKGQVGLKFTDPNPNFWGLASPPEDWKPSHPGGLSGNSL